MHSLRLLTLLGTLSPLMLTTHAQAAPVSWVDWTSGQAGASGSASGVLTIADQTVNVTFSGELRYAQTSGGANYWNPTAPYTSAQVDNAPPAADILTFVQPSARTFTFSAPVQDLFLAIVSMNSNSYVFDRDFEIVSFGAGYWGNGTMTRTDLGNGSYALSGTGEPHGVIRFTGAISTFTLTSTRAEDWHGVTVGTYGIAAPVPEPSGWALMLAGLGLTGALVRRR